MKIREPWLTDWDFVCYRCRRSPSEIPEYVNNPEGETPEAFVFAEEGTLNMSTGRFCCTECYIAAGMPTAPWPGWKAP